MVRNTPPDAVVGHKVTPDSKGQWYLGNMAFHYLDIQNVIFQIVGNTIFAKTQQ